VVVVEPFSRVVAQWACRASAWWAGRHWPGWPVGEALVGQQAVIWWNWGGLEGWQVGGIPPVFSVYRDVEKSSTG
jgi:hypothetical protein